MASSALEIGTVQDIAQQFIAARRLDRVLNAYPGGRMPVSLEDGYRIQDAAIAMDGRALLGWKVGRIPEPAASTLGSNRLAGPIFSIVDMRAESGSAPVMPVLAGFAAAEGELLARIATGAASAGPDAPAARLIDALHLGIEIASSPFPEINGHGAPVTISDFGNNHGAVIGPSLHGHALDDVLAATMTVRIDGAVIGTGRPGDVLDGPLGAVRFIVDHMARRNLGDPAGLWVSCGAVTGVHPVGAHADVEVELLGHVQRCRTADFAADTQGEVA